MEVKIKTNEGIVDATIEMVDGVMLVSPLVEEKIEAFEQKDGDIISTKYGISIYKEGSKNPKLLNCYCDYITDLKKFVINKTEFVDKESMRRATPEETKKLFERIDKEGYEWDAESKVLKKKKWKPNYGDTYFRPEFNNDILKFQVGVYKWLDDNVDKNIYEQGHAYGARFKCEEMVKKLNDAIKNVEE